MDTNIFFCGKKERKKKHKECSWPVAFSNSRFRMFLLSSSSTLGLWLSLLRRNTRTTFCTIFPPPLSSSPWARSGSLSYPTNAGSSFFTALLCLHLASKPRLCCFGRGAPHIWNSCSKCAIFFFLLSPFFLFFLSRVRDVLFSADLNVLPAAAASSLLCARSQHAARLSLLYYPPRSTSAFSSAS